MAGQSFLVAGGSRGIGAAIADELRSRGWDGLAVARSLPETERTVRADLRDPASVLLIQTALRERFPHGLQLLAACAGDYLEKPLEELAAADLLGQFESSVVTAHHALLAAREALARGTPSRVILCGLEDPLAGRRLAAAHAAAKAALLALGSSWARILSPEGVRVAVVPIAHVEHPDAAPRMQLKGAPLREFVARLLQDAPPPRLDRSTEEP